MSPWWLLAIVPAALIIGAVTGYATALYRVGTGLWQ